MDFKKLIQVADVFGTETKKQAEVQEGIISDALKKLFGLEDDQAEAAEAAAEEAGADVSDIPPEVLDQVPELPQPSTSDTSPNTPTQDDAPAQTATPAQPQAPGSDTAPQTDTGSADPVNSSEWDDPDNTTFSARLQGKPVSITYNPNRNSLRIQGEDYDRSFEGVAVRDGQIVAGDYGFPLDPVDQRLAFGDDLQEPMMREIGDAVRQAQSPEAQTDAELDADSADNATQGDSAADVAQDDAARTQAQGDALAGRLDTETPSLLDAYNNGGRRALDSVRDLQTALSRLGFDPNGIDGKYGRGTYAAVQEFQRQNGLTVDGEAGPTTMAKLQELLNGNATQEQPQGDSAADVAQDDAARTAPQTDAELDADSADNATPAQPAQTNAELDSDSADNATPATTPPQPQGNLDSFTPWKDQLEAAGYTLSSSGRSVKANNGGTVASINQRGNVFFGSDRVRTIVRGGPRAESVKIKGNIMNENKNLDECGGMPTAPQNEGNPVTMSVTLNASGEQHVQDLIRMMQLAGAKDAAPVAAMHVGPQMDKHDDMVNMMRMMDGQDESVEEEWDNAPEEDYRDHKHMTKDLSGGLNREKKAYAKAQDGDNAMAVESIKDVLMQALEEKYANDAQRMAVHAAKDEKKKNKK